MHGGGVGEGRGEGEGEEGGVLDDSVSARPWANLGIGGGGRRGSRAAACRIGIREVAALGLGQDAIHEKGASKAALRLAWTLHRPAWCHGRRVLTMQSIMPWLAG